MQVIPGCILGVSCEKGRLGNGQSWICVKDEHLPTHSLGDVLQRRTILSENGGVLKFTNRSHALTRARRWKSEEEAFERVRAQAGMVFYYKVVKWTEPH